MTNPYTITEYSELTDDSDLYFHNSFTLGNFTIEFKVSINGKLHTLYRQNDDLGRGSHFASSNAIEQANDVDAVYDALTQEDWDALDAEAHGVFSDLHEAAKDRLKKEQNAHLVELNGHYHEMVVVASYMDDDIREELHDRMAGKCTEQEFLDAYVRAHEEKYGEEFDIL